MAGITFNIDVAEGLKKLKNTTPAAKLALVRAVNGGMLTARNQAARLIVGAGYRFKISTVKNALKIDKASFAADEVIGSIRVSGRPIPLIKFDVQPAPVRRGAGFARPAVGIWATVMGKEYGNSHAFYARVNSGKGEHVGVFERTSSSRLPIKQLYGPSLPDALGSADVYVPAKAYFDERFAVVLEQQLKYLVGG
jgi:hypothetical protein